MPTWPCSYSPVKQNNSLAKEDKRVIAETFDGIELTSDTLTDFLNSLFDKEMVPFLSKNKIYKPETHPTLFDDNSNHLLDSSTLKKFQKLDKKVNSLGMNSTFGTHTVKATSTFYDYEISQLFKNISLDDKDEFCKAIGISSHGLASIDIVDYSSLPNPLSGTSPLMYNVTIEKYVDQIPF